MWFCGCDEGRGAGEGREGRKMAMIDATAGESMPTREGDFSIEGRGIEPIPEGARYGSVGRIFTVWFTPNLVPAA